MGTRVDDSTHGNLVEPLSYSRSLPESMTFSHIQPAMSNWNQETWSLKGLTVALSTVTKWLKTLHSSLNYGPVTHTQTK